MNFKAVDLYLKELKRGKTSKDAIDDADIADYLEDIKSDDEKKFFEYLNSLPLELRAETFVELPNTFQVDLILKSEAKELVDIIEALDSDDATDLMIVVSKIDFDKEREIFNLLSDKRQKEIEELIYYEDDEAGSIMQKELLSIEVDKTVQEALNKLASLKKDGVGFISHLFVVDRDEKLLKVIAMDDLILEHRSVSLESIIQKYQEPHKIISHDNIEKALQYIEKYDLTSLAVVDRMGHLLGQITHDDMVDIMQERATKQLYNINNVDANEEVQESFSKTTKTRATWLFINLINAVIVSVVIGVFEETLEAIVALAVLMPIVANMAGTASIQTMTVIIRQMAIGEINIDNIKPIFKKEFSIASLNGVLFGIVSAGVSQFWFGDKLISIAIGVSMFISFISAGILGAIIPMFIKKAKFDPAVASSVIVITAVDIIGFFSFLWLAEMIIL